MSLIWVGFAAFFFVALACGVRLVRLSMRTKQLPELLIGIGVLGIGPVGFGLSVAAQQLDDGTLATGLLMLGGLAVAVGVSSKLIFNWRVYHPASPGVRLLALAGIAAVVGCWLHLAARGYASYAVQGPVFYLRSTVQIGALLWGSGEALRYWGLMTRRARLGLGDPVVANRFLLWGIGAGAAGVGSLIGVVAQIVTGVLRTGSDWVLASSSMHGLAAAVAMWLAFMPPQRYLRFVRERARAEA